jgi:hypothetical protein
MGRVWNLATGGTVPESASTPGPGEELQWIQSMIAGGRTVTPFDILPGANVSLVGLTM